MNGQLLGEMGNGDGSTEGQRRAGSAGDGPRNDYLPRCFRASTSCSVVSGAGALRSRERRKLLSSSLSCTSLPCVAMRAVNSLSGLLDEVVGWHQKIGIWRP